MIYAILGGLALFALGLLVGRRRAGGVSALSAAVARTWRDVLARLPLPMLALAASYGVYSFAALFVPQWVAVVQAAAFELTYIGLAVVQGLDAAARRRATLISVGAVVTSVLYNTLAGWFHREPTLFDGAGPVASLCFAVLHGAPLAWVAYLVADLLLHTSAAGTAPTLALARVDADIAPQPVYAPPAPVYAEEPADADTLRTLLADTPAAVVVEPAMPQAVADTIADIAAEMRAYEAAMPICACGCGKPLSASEQAGRRRTKRGHKEPTL